MSGSGGQLEALRKVYGQTWDMYRRGVTYVAVRRWQLKPTEQYCGLTNRVEKNTFSEFAAELSVQESMYKSLITFGNRPAAS